MNFFTMLSWSEGNPGAADFLSTAAQTDAGVTILDKLQNLTTIRGTNLYVLYSDLCGKDLNIVKALVDNCPAHILEDACSRQDYSGRGLVAKYLPVES